MRISGWSSDVCSSDLSTYGTLTLNADGSYSYALDNANSAVQGLSAGQILTEIFSYTNTDVDGDPATTTLTITINGANDGVTVHGLTVPGGEEDVNEEHRSGERREGKAG